MYSIVMERVRYGYVQQNMVTGRAPACSISAQPASACVRCSAIAWTNISAISVLLRSSVRCGAVRCSDAQIVCDSMGRWICTRAYKCGGNAIVHGTCSASPSLCRRTWYDSRNASDNQSLSTWFMTPLVNAPASPTASVARDRMRQPACYPCLDTYPFYIVLHAIRWTRCNDEQRLLV